MSRWGIVIGIDDYGDERLRLNGAVRDAVSFYSWVTSPDGADVPTENCRLLLGPGQESNPTDVVGEPRIFPASKGDIVNQLTEVVALAGADGNAEQFYFYFSGHGITAELFGREEAVLVMPGVGTPQTPPSIAVRSLAEYLETTSFKDQFFFLDACRKAPGRQYTDVGRWPISRRRDPGKPPVQQFILYATAPGHTAVEVGWDEAVGAFTEVLMAGLEGDERAKAWSWDRNCYEVRWERLATYVNSAMRIKGHTAVASGEPPPEGWPIQIPQDAGSRGVADRERDPRLASYQRGRFGDVELTLELKAESPIDEAEVTVLDAIGTPVVRALRVPGGTVKVQLPPRTYAARVVTPDGRVGSVKAPIELYDALTDEIELRLSDGPPESLPGRASQPSGKIKLLSLDPLSMAEVRDESGRVIAVRRVGSEFEHSPGFYHIRHLRPERVLGDEPVVGATTVVAGEPQEETFVMLASDDDREVWLGARPPDPFVVRLAESLGGVLKSNFLVPFEGAEPMAWAQPSTVLAAAIGGALTGDVSLERLGAVPSPAGLPSSGVALYMVAGDGNPAALDDLCLRLWPTGSRIPAESERTRLVATEHGVAGAVIPIEDAGPHWLSIERRESSAVLSLPVQPNRLVVIVAQVDPGRTRLYQFHPPVTAAEAASGRLRRFEHLERLLLSGALDGARPLAAELAADARNDPFAGLLAGYVLLRLGLNGQLGDLASTIVDVAPTLSDAYILRGEYCASAGQPDAANQAFADAVNAGIPAFGEGLTRLVEGLRKSGYQHPRGAFVRHMLRQHIRGSMWAAFTPSRPLREGELVISGADIGYEG